MTFGALHNAAGTLIRRVTGATRSAPEKREAGGAERLPRGAIFACVTVMVAAAAAVGLIGRVIQP